MDSRLERMANLLVHRCIGTRPGEWVVIQTGIAAEPLAAACTRTILAAGGHPTTVFQSEWLHEIELTEGNDDQLQWVSPTAELVVERADAIIQILAPENTRTLQEVDPAKQATRSRAMGHISETFMRRFIEPMRLAITEYPTEALAQDAGMSLRQYEEFVYDAALLNEPDPAAAWDALGARLNQLVAWLSNKSELRVVSPGTDLRLNVEGRTWIADDGHLNFPGGEVFTGPHEDSVEGTVAFNFPAFLGGNEASGVRLRFEGGKVTDLSATTNQGFLEQMLGMDDGARRLGEFAFGANPNIQRFTKNTLFDEKIGGTLHMALGRSIPQTEGRNASNLHWDMVLDLRRDSEVTADGELFSRNGVFQI